jgi:hypothetical protein
VAEWVVWSDVYDGEEVLIEADSAAEAAAEYADATDSEDCTWAFLDEADYVWVRLRGNDAPPIVYLVSGEAIPTYYASCADELLLAAFVGAVLRTLGLGPVEVDRV